jgi:hypothetical protein
VHCAFVSVAEMIAIHADFEAARDCDWGDCRCGFWWNRPIRAVPVDPANADLVSETSLCVSTTGAWPALRG